MAALIVIKHKIAINIIAITAELFFYLTVHVWCFQVNN